MGKSVILTAEDRHTLDAYRADPAGAPRGGLVVIQEIFGVNAHIRRVCDRFAEAGYSAIAPAIFDRAEKAVELDYSQEGIARGRAIRARLTIDGALMDITAAASVLKRMGKVGAVGYCWGGSLGWLAATRLGLPSVCYYGAMILDFVQEVPQAPVLLHFGETDASIPMETVDRIRAAHPRIPVHLYPAGHGFNCEARADYHEASAKLALTRTLHFFAEQLG
ncbi:MAG: dienelactone hydrolase family protein [Gemmatimonadales bacterium]